MFQKPTYEELFEENQMLKAIIKSLSERISELEAILKQNSQTSSKPPSSDGYKKPKTTSSRKKSDSGTGYVIETKLVTTIEKHQAIKRICPLSCETIRGQLPVFIKSTIQYGPETIALVSVLNTIGAVSIDRIHDILHGACRLPISTGTIYNMVKKAVSSVAPSVEVIKEKVKALSLAHFDETGKDSVGLMWSVTVTTPA